MKMIKMMKLKVLITLVVILSLLALPAIGGEWGSGVKQIQRGVITIPSASTSATATLSPAVVVTKTELRHLGQSTAGVEFDKSSRIVLTNTTTVTATKGVSSGGDVLVSWEIIEHY